jgi:hypothetical protein
MRIWQGRVLYDRNDSIAQGKIPPGPYRGKPAGSSRSGRSARSAGKPVDPVVSVAAAYAQTYAKAYLKALRQRGLL